MWAGEWGGAQSSSRIPESLDGLRQRPLLRCTHRPWACPDGAEQAAKPGSLWSANAPTAPLPQPEGLPAAPPEGHQEPPLLLKTKSLHSFPHFCRSSLFILRLFVQSAESQIIT